MTIHRRFLLGTVAGVCLGASATVGSGRAAAGGAKRRNTSDAVGSVLQAAELGLRPDAQRDQTGTFQRAIDIAARAQVPLQLQPGRYVCSQLQLRSQTRLQGVGEQTLIALSGSGASIKAEDCKGVSLCDLSVRGELFRDSATNPHLISLEGCTDLLVERVTLSDCPGTALSLRRCQGRVTASRFSNAGRAAIMSVDATGLSVDHNDVSRCHNNGILIWREQRGVDGTLVAHNRVSQIAAMDGGSGQNGNGINIFRAGGVIVQGNHISDCAFTAVRGNSASNLQIIGNNTARLGEVALYSEFAFEGVVIANNVVEQAATGISVTNFNEGGRLAVVQGNVVRSLFRREQEVTDKRGIGISVEADTSVTGNTIEGAPTAGISIGWHEWMRNVAATGNVVRDCGVGVGVTGTDAAGAALVSNNVFDRCRNGGIRQTKGNAIYGADLTNSTGQVASGRLSATGNLMV